MALYSVAFMGSTPIGGPVVGWVGQMLGPRSALVLGGVAAVVAASMRLALAQPPAADDVELGIESAVASG